METRANHLLIGIFMLVLIGAGFAFVLWLARIGGDRDWAFYDIYFTDSVAGLGVGGDVRFNGIKVGDVAEIDIDHQNPNRVRVVVRINPDTPIRADSYAILQLQGITGLSFVQIAGGTTRTPLLAYKRGEPHPQIQSRPSQITQLIEKAPELLIKGTDLLDKASGLVSEQNQQLVTAILVDISRLTNQIAGLGPEFQSITRNADRTAAEFAEAAVAIRKTSERLDTLSVEAEKTIVAARRTVDGVDQLVRTDATKMIREAQTTMVELRKAIDTLSGSASSFAKVAETVDGMLVDNRATLDEFLVEDLPQVGRFLSDARQLMASMNRLFSRIDENPSRVLFGDKAPERARE